MVWQYVAVAALIGLGVPLDSDKDHDEVVQETADSLKPELPENAAPDVDHVGEGYQNPRSDFDEVTNAPGQHIPDVVVTPSEKHISSSKSGLATS